jgi:hypothetical protein
VLALGWFAGEMVVAARSGVARLGTDGCRGLDGAADCGRLTAFAFRDGQALWGTTRGFVLLYDLESSFLGAAEVHAEEVTAVHLVAPGVAVSAGKEGTLKLLRLSEAGLRVVGGVPAGGQVTALGGAGPHVVAGLADGSLAGFYLHEPPSAGASL